MFSKNNESFTCINCGKKVEEHPTSSRDHCNHCLVGLHVDIDPGDRLNECKGILEPIGLKTVNNKEQIVYKCLKCSKTLFCVTAPDDNREKVVELAQLRWEDSL